MNYVRNTYGGFYWQYAYAAWNARDQRTNQSFVKQACSGGCTLQLCGNDRIDPGETCEDDNIDQYGRAMSGDGCSETCTLESGFTFGSGICGDDTVNAGEQCDDGGRCIDPDGKVTGDYCRFDNFNPFRNFCPGADGTSGTDDDGTCVAMGKDGCSETCQLEPLAQCGNGILEPYEDCDSGGICGGTAPKKCFEQTTGGGNICGEVIVGGKIVVCPRNKDLHCSTDADCGGSGPCLPLPGDGCGIDCRFEIEALCGNGITEPHRGEACDPGSVCKGGPKNGESCSSNTAICGSGRCERVMTNPLCSSECDRVSGVCGNGVKEGAEQCDEGAKNSNEANACRAGTESGRPACVFAYCGDLVIDRGEECDDGNTIAKDGCTHCLIDFCGNGRLDAGETCDDGSTVNNDGCSEWCLLENICGNANREGEEECDDGNAGSGDGCSAECLFEYCGDAIPQPGLGEECDEGSQNGDDPGSCRVTCQLPSCGDAIKDQNEACDPAKHCTHNPMQSCTGDEDCSLGICDMPFGAIQGTCSADSSKSCSSDAGCLLGECRVLDTKSCAANCTEKPVCGDSLTHGSEQCDDGNLFAEDGCDAECMLERPALCGDGKKNGGEQCDDGNTVGSDGCTETCQLEPMECGGECEELTDRFLCGDGMSCQMGDKCDYGKCTLRSECALLCTFGFCGNLTVDPGEQCDDGGRCMDDPSLTCVTHADCNVQTCMGEDASEGILGTCSDAPLRSCMRDADCGSLCVPKGGDGCSPDCQSEGPQLPPSAFLTVCQEENSSMTGMGGTHTSIGTAQVAVWQDTLLEPFRNRSLPAAGMLGRPLSDLFPWIPWETWWSTGVSCFSAHFPNALGNHVRAVAGCMENISRYRTIPVQKAVMPFQPVGITSYPACQEPRAQLLSTVEIPAPVPVSLRPYHPKELVASFERIICQQSGFPRRSFLFLCTTASTIAPRPRSLQDLLPVNLQTGGNSSLRELMLAHALDAAYRASESGLLDYLEEATMALRTSIETATAMFRELSRIELTETVCPIDGTALCPPAN